MPRKKAKHWPAGGKIQIGFDDEAELARLRHIVRGYNKRNRRECLHVRETETQAYAELVYGAPLYDPLVRNRHPGTDARTGKAKGYMNVRDGPMCAHVLILSTDDPVHSGCALIRTLNWWLRADYLLGDKWHMGEPRHQVYEFKRSSIDRFLGERQLPPAWLGGAEGPDGELDLRVRPIKYEQRLSSETTAWATAVGALQTQAERSDFLAKHPDFVRHEDEFASWAGGWRVGEGQERREFADEEAARAYAAELRARRQALTESEERDKWVEDVWYHLGEGGKRSASGWQFPNPAKYDYDEERETFILRRTAEILAADRADRANELAAERAAAAAVAEA